MSTSAKTQKHAEEQILDYRGSTSRNWTLDGCPRCHGDVFLETEEGDLLAHCIQCGYVALGSRNQSAQQLTI